MSSRRPVTGRLRSHRLRWLKALLPTAAAGRLGRRIFSMSEAEAARVTSACLQAVPGVLLAGGWGVEALGPRRRRRHFDLDLVLPPSARAAAVEALAGVGYHVAVPRSPGGWWSEWVVVLRNAAGRVTELVIVEDAVLAALMERAAAAVAGDPGTTLGCLAGLSLPCLSPGLQLVLHSGYRLNRSQRFDLRFLRRVAGQ